MTKSTRIGKLLEKKEGKVSDRGNDPTPHTYKLTRERETTTLPLLAIKPPPCFDYALLVAVMEASYGQFIYSQIRHIRGCCTVIAA